MAWGRSRRAASNPSLRPASGGAKGVVARSRRVLPIGAFFGDDPCRFLGSGGAKRVVTGPWVRREWGPVRIRDSS